VYSYEQSVNCGEERALPMPRVRPHLEVQVIHFAGLHSIQICKSFLVLFFKKEQKESTSFLKKRSKKLLIIKASKINDGGPPARREPKNFVRSG
jgi:hypothetical protein